MGIKFKNQNQMETFAFALLGVSAYSLGLTADDAASQRICASYDKYWNELSSRDQNQWEILGHTQETWDNNQIVWADTTSWDDLTTRKNALGAAYALGFTYSSWTNGVC